MSEQELTNEEIEHKEKKARKLLIQLGEAVRISYKQLKTLAIKTAEEFEKAGTIETRDICLEIIKGLRPELEGGIVHIATVYSWLPSKYKRHYTKRKFRDHEISKDLPTLEVELMETVASLDFQQIRQMSLNQFIQKYREIYLHKLQTMTDDEVHYQALLLSYLQPMIRDMLELTETHRSELKKKNDMLGK